MSRSNPNLNAPNPALRWFEWNGEHGVIRYYDKDAKENVVMPMPFTYMLLDELGSVRGWHDASESGIYSNEVRDTTKDAFIVKSFKGGTLAEGLYRSVKDRINTLGGQFVSNCYIAVRLDGNGLAICSLRLKGAALGAWMEFRKAQRKAVYDQAIRITGFTEGKKGRITYRMPVFELKKVSEASNSEASTLDKQLQVWLESYLQRKTRDQADDVIEDQDDSGIEDAHEQDAIAAGHAPLTDDDIPF